MERELFSKYLKLMEDEEESLQSLATEKMSNYNNDVEHCQDVVVNDSSIENFFCDGKYGSIAAYWAIYVYFINRENWQLNRPESDSLASLTCQLLYTSIGRNKILEFIPHSVSAN